MPPDSSEPDAEPGFLLNGYPRTLSQVEELNSMIAFTGHQLDARVVQYTVDPKEIVQRLVQRAEVESRADDTGEVIRRRQEVYLRGRNRPLMGVYRKDDRQLEMNSMGKVDDVTKRIFEALDVIPQLVTWIPPMGLLDRGLEIKTREQIEGMRRAGLVVGQTLELLRSAVRAGISTRELDADRRGQHPLVRGDAVVPGLPRVPGLDLRVGQRRGGPRHPG